MALPAPWPRSFIRVVQGHAHAHLHLRCAAVYKLRLSTFQIPNNRKSSVGQAAVESHGSKAPGRPPAADLSNSPFHDLGLEDLEDEVPAVRVRQHVNPLRKEFQIPHAPLPWHEVFTDPTKPLLVDVGCGSGRFLLKRLKMLEPEQNGLGIEIRRALVKRANKWAELLRLDHRLHYVFANATVSLSSLLRSYPGPITQFAIQMPDPQFKNRHKKRRVVQPQLIRDMAQLLVPNGQVFLQSDVEEVAVDMRNLFEQYGADVFQPAEQHQAGPVFFSDEVFVRKRRPAASAKTGMKQSEGDALEVQERGLLVGSTRGQDRVLVAKAQGHSFSNVETAGLDGTESRGLGSSTSEGVGDGGQSVASLFTGVGEGKSRESHGMGEGKLHESWASQLTSNDMPGECAGAGMNSAAAADAHGGMTGLHRMATVDAVTGSSSDTGVLQSTSDLGLEGLDLRDNVSGSPSLSEIANSSLSCDVVEFSVDSAKSDVEIGVAGLNDNSESELHGNGTAYHLDGSDGGFTSQWRSYGWLQENPMGLPTEREHFALSQGGRVYRVLLRKVGAGTSSS